jgi:cytochrome P450
MLGGIMDVDPELVSQDFANDPYPLLARLQAEDPVHWSDAWQAWLVTRYDDVERVARDPGTFSNAGRVAARLRALPVEARADMAVLETHFATGLIDSDPPVHTRLRSLVMKAFTPRTVESLRPRITAIARSLIARVEGSGRADVVKDFAYPLPAAVISEILGLPEGQDQLKTWSERINAFYGANGEERVQAARNAQQAVLEARSWLSGLVAERRSRPRDDLLTALMTAHVQDDRLTESELLATCLSLMIAGHVTTTSLISVGLLTLLRNPPQLKTFIAEPGLARGAIEELVRFETPVQRIGRVLNSDLTLRGKQLRKGQLVLMLNGAANRDPQVFPNPNQLDIARGDSRHAAFGVGIHFCVGAALARLEAPIALRELVSLRDIRVVAPGPKWVRESNLRELESLPVAFERPDVEHLPG